MKPYDKKIVLEDGREFYGYGFGSDKEAINEIVFNTSMVGYQEIVSDPSYTDQMVCMTYPLIGNYGMTDEGRRGEELEKAQGEARRTTPEKKPSIRERLAEAKRECGERKPPDKVQQKKPPEHDL